jgi:hypothetical protein
MEGNFSLMAKNFGAPQGVYHISGTKIALLTGMIEKGSEEDTPSSKSFSASAKWWEVAINYLPTLLKLLAALGLFRSAAQARQNLVARRAAKRHAMLTRKPNDSFWA